MQTYICLLRGINVAGKNSIKMEPLRNLLEALPVEKLATYLQSGNLVFRAQKQEVTFYEERIHQLILKKFHIDVSVMVFTKEKFLRGVAKNPFLEENACDKKSLHVTFVSAVPPFGLRQKVAKYSAGNDRIHFSGSTIFLYCPGGYGRSKYSNNILEKNLLVRATTRNWNTVEALSAMVNDWDGDV